MISIKNRAIKCKKRDKNVIVFKSIYYFNYIKILSTFFSERIITMQIILIFKVLDIYNSVMQFYFNFKMTFYDCRQMNFEYFGVLPVLTL